MLAAQIAPLITTDTGVSIMTNFTLAQLEYLSQQLSEELITVKHLTSKAWIELGLARDTIRSLSLTYDEWLKEKDLGQELSPEQ